MHTKQAVHLLWGAVMRLRELLPYTVLYLLYTPLPHLPPAAPLAPGTSGRSRRPSCRP